MDFRDSLHIDRLDVFWRWNFESNFQYFQFWRINKLNTMEKRETNKKSMCPCVLHWCVNFCHLIGLCRETKKRNSENLLFIKINQFFGWNFYFHFFFVFGFSSKSFKIHGSLLMKNGKNFVYFKFQSVLEGKLQLAWWLARNERTEKREKKRQSLIERSFHLIPSALIV